MATTSYALGLGSNRMSQHGRPEQTLVAALDRLGLEVTARSRIIRTAPLGPGTRRYANMAAIVSTDLAPPALLRLVKATERSFGRRASRRWGDRVLDIDLLLWSGGRWRSRTLALPHVGLSARRFVLDPLGEIMPGWRISGMLTVHHLRARLTRRHPLHKSARRGSP